MRARNCKISRDFTTGKWSVSFDIDRPEDLPQGELDLTIKPYKPKRSLSANAYMWDGEWSEGIPATGGSKFIADEQKGK